METNRRNWIKQIGIGAAGIGLTKLNAFATPFNLISADVLDDTIRLNMNENVYGPSASARIAMTEIIATGNRYNLELTSKLISAIAKKNQVNADNVLISAGSTEILDLVARYSALKKGSIVVAAPTFSHWTDVAQNLGLRKISVPLTADKRNNLAAMLKAIEPDTKLVYICNPNNPTGTICDKDELIAFIKEASKKTLVLVDEAYIEYTDQQSLSSLTTDNKNLIVAKTFSKIYGLAGCRIGYAIAHIATIEEFGRLQSWPSGNVSVVSRAGALASLQDDDFVKETRSLNEKVRKYTINQLEQLNISCIASYSNFIYFSLANYKKDFFEQLKNNKILGTDIREEQGKWSRITVGTMNEMQKFIAAVK